MNKIRIAAATTALAVIVAGTAAAQMQAPEAAAEPTANAAEMHAQHHPDGAAPGGMMGMMAGMMNPQMMQQMMQHMGGMGGGMGGGIPMMGMMGGGAGAMPCPDMEQTAELTPDTVRQHLEGHVAMTGNERLKVGDVAAQDDGTIVATIVTRAEGAVVDKFAIDPRTHTRKRVD
ncbi:MAG: hypothetical protein H3C38_14450 [Rhodospirillales bacterium]|nr:hypothetical protein [Rhodospirillales bacterium]